MINKYYIIGGVLVAGFLGYKVLLPKPAAQDANSNATPDQALYTTGFGSNVISAGGLPSGSTANNSFADLAAAIGLKSQNDLTLGMASIDASKTIGLATVNADLTTSLGELGNSRLHDAYANMSLMQSLGLNAIQAFTDAGKAGMSLLYTDPTKNIPLVSGRNSTGDTTTTFGTISAMSDQSTYDQHTYTDINGVKKNNLDIKPVTNPTPVAYPYYPVGVNSNGAGFGDGQHVPTGFQGGSTLNRNCLLYTSPSPRDRQKSRMPSSA